MRIIYADSMFLLNFTIDYLLLLATGKICALPLRRWRMLLGAAWGGIYAVLSLIGPEMFSSAAVKILSGLALTTIAYGGTRRFSRTAIVFFAVTAAFGGAVYAALSIGGLSPGEGPVLSLSTKTLVLSFAICYAALSLVFRSSALRAEREIRSLEVRLRGRSVSLRAMRDTGNDLRDSNGRPVILAQWSALSPLFPELHQHRSIDPASLLLELSSLSGMEGRCRLLSCLTATDSGGLLALIRADALLLDGETADHIHIAVTGSTLSADGDYQALF